MEEREKLTQDPRARPDEWPSPPPVFPARGNGRRSPGEAWVFARTAGAGGLGHTGWAFKMPGDDTYMFGATESVPVDRRQNGSRGRAVIRRGRENGTWVLTGTRDQMLRTFRNPAADPEVAATTPWAKPYDKYRCQSTTVAIAAAATIAVAASRNAGYLLVFNNCLGNTIKILRAYGAIRLPAATYLRALPNNWFNGLTDPWGPIQDLGRTDGRPAALPNPAAPI
ncbi:hypothetical protein [Actinoallomurus iriomotensis]|uniref:Uncharacterized protein n=1 Tax=Actinoallomurus iriomotensis TaxID=478107 RepID=A0A9W6RNK9_9ACTN|nr:hypothetical protein [Actinoallomurus iriomotensis]GLY78465.1 hypothetical protein Airi01_067320 [Actinoallomurus iriomotensis]